MTIIIILESDSTTITDSIAITDSISNADSISITDSITTTNSITITDSITITAIVLPHLLLSPSAIVRDLTRLGTGQSCAHLSRGPMPWILCPVFHPPVFVFCPCDLGFCSLYFLRLRIMS